MFNIIIEETCNGFWDCLNTSDLIQLFAVLVAAIAAIFSYLSVSASRKQFRIENEARNEQIKIDKEARRLSIQPYFKIKKLDKNAFGYYSIQLKNEGYPYFVLKSYEWEGSKGIKIEQPFNGYVNRKINNVIKESYDIIVVSINIKDAETEGEGNIYIYGRNLTGDSVTFVSPKITFEKGELTNKYLINEFLEIKY